MINTEEMNRFLHLRSKIFELIDKALDQDGHHKSYEGAMSIHFPNRFENPGILQIELFCYVLGGKRKYEWKGKTLTEILDKMTTDIDRWEYDLKLGI